MIRELHCFVLVCDVCGVASDCVGALADQHFCTSEMARGEARLFYGWTGDVDRDVCPDCGCAAAGHDWRGPCWRPDPAASPYRYCAGCDREEPLPAGTLDPPVSDLR